MAAKRQQHVLGLDVGPPQHPRLVLGQAQKVGDMPREEAHNSMIANWFRRCSNLFVVAKRASATQTEGSREVGPHRTIALRENRATDPPLGSVSHGMGQVGQRTPMAG